MKTATAAMMLMLVPMLLFAVPAQAADAAPGVIAPPAGFTPLFNGRDLDGWWGAGTEDPRKWAAMDADKFAEKQAASRQNIAQHWSVEDGVLVNDGQGLYLTTNENYGDFELWVDYNMAPLGDSGVYLRGIPQVQIWDTSEAGGKWNIGADKGSGGLWNNTAGNPGKDPMVHADRPFGQWNHLRIIMVGERVTVYMNDRLLVDHARLENYFDRSKPVPREGPIQLQTHGGEIRWRNVFIREIKPDEANAILARHDGAAYESVFNGADFTGWAGPVQNYEVADHAIMCQPGHGGTIYTEDEYGDFSVRFEFRLPPGGNNGLAIRYPGQGDTAYVGMCELQVLDNTHEKYAKLDDRQYHGSAYGMAPAHRGYLRAPGVWNSQQVTVQGSRITVELNGTMILDTDVATIEQFMYEAEKFGGRTRTRGHFGFAGHNDPVAYRSVRIRRLDDAG